LERETPQNCSLKEEKRPLFRANLRKWTIANLVVNLVLAFDVCITRKSTVGYRNCSFLCVLTD
jgi:hypothetical protein